MKMTRKQQDDFIAWMPDGRMHGSENGCFAKTFALSEDTEPEIYRATTSPQAYLENVFRNEDGTLDFFNESFTQNGRSVFPLSALGRYEEARNIPPVSAIVILNRARGVVPMAAYIPHMSDLTGQDELIASKARQMELAREAGMVVLDLTNAYEGVDGRTLWGVGVDADISTASLKAVVSAVNRALRAARVREEEAAPALA